MSERADNFTCLCVCRGLPPFSPVSPRIPGPYGLTRTGSHRPLLPIHVSICSCIHSFCHHNAFTHPPILSSLLLPLAGAHYVAAKLLRKVLRDGHSHPDAGSGAPMKRTGSMMGAPRPDMQGSPSDFSKNGVDFRGDFRNGAILGVICTGLGVMISLGMSLMARRSRL